MPKIDVKQITGYESMTAEEKIKALESYNVEFDTSGWVKKDVFDKTAGELSKLKKDVATQNGAAKSAEERIKDLEKQLTVNDLEKRYLASGYNAEDAARAAIAFYDRDTDKLFELQNKNNEAIRKSAAAESMKQTPPPQNGANDGAKDYLKLITAAQENGDMALAASLITEQFNETQNNNGGIN